MKTLDIQHLIRTGTVREVEIQVRNLSLNFAEYIVASAKFFQETDQRIGQAYFNALHVLRPDIAAIIRGSDDDAFYNNDLLPQMLARVNKLW